MIAPLGKRMGEDVDDESDHSSTRSRSPPNLQRNSPGACSYSNSMSSTPQPMIAIANTSAQDDDSFPLTHTNEQQSSQTQINMSNPLSLNKINDFFAAKVSSRPADPIISGNRTRLYTAGHKGPFIVRIQELSTKIKPIQFSSYINDKYKSVRMLKRSPGQLKVILDCRIEANELVVNGIFKDYRVSIPADLVEIEGAFNIEDLCDLEDMNTLISNGIGGFKNTSLGFVKIIHAERITRPDAKYPLLRRVLTNTVKVVFEGQVLPNYVILEGLRIQIRPFHQKPMYCDNCQQFGHTAKFCRRKPKCARCGAAHKTNICEDANSNQDMCPYCLTTPNHARAICPYFKEVGQDFNNKQSLRRKGRYTQAVALARTNEHENNPESVANEVDQFPLLQNRFRLLLEDSDPPQQQTSDSRPSATMKPVNPYSKALKQSQVRSSRPRSASKRRRVDDSSSVHNINRSNTANLNTPTPTHCLPVQSNSSNTTFLAIKTAILVLLKQAKVAANWVAIIEVLIDPLLQAILPQSSEPSDNYDLPVRAGRP